MDTVSRPHEQQDLATLTALIEAGRVMPVIDRTYPFADLRAAIRYSEEGYLQGKVVVTVG